MTLEPSPAMKLHARNHLARVPLDAGSLVISVGPKSVSVCMEIDLAAAQFGKGILQRPS